MLFSVKNPHIYQSNTSVHGMNTRQQNKPRVSVRLSLSVKIFNHLPQNIFKIYNNLHIFKILLRDYLVKNAFYFIEEFFQLIMIVS